ncbi:MAG: hypothetical protein J7M26_00460 [Armatimonadetes bacterium]|nr:hypothetical protein [Armatimonadota bacterium]
MMPAAEQPQPFLTPVLDYGRSFLGTLGPGNYPRFWVESRCFIEHEPSGLRREYFQCGSCKAEDTFAEKNLLRDPNYDFLPVFSEEELIVFRRHAWCAEDYGETGRERAGWADGAPPPPGDYRQVRPMKGHPVWGGIVPKLREAQARPLASAGEVIEATQAGLPLIAQTVLRDDASGVRAVLEYPIKTINCHPDRGLWQVDTGPVVLPDLTAPLGQWAPTLELAFVVFNTYDWVDVVVEVPTPVLRDGQEMGRVYHYSDIRHLEAKSLLLAQED